MFRGAKHHKVHFHAEYGNDILVSYLSSTPEFIQLSGMAGLLDLL